MFSWTAVFWTLVIFAYAAFISCCVAAMCEGTVKKAWLGFAALAVSSAVLFGLFVGAVT